MVEASISTEADGTNCSTDVLVGALLLAIAILAVAAAIGDQPAEARLWRKPSWVGTRDADTQAVRLSRKSVSFQRHGKRP